MKKTFNATKMKSVGLTEKIRTNLGILATNNPDPMSVMENEEHKGQKISPKVLSSMRDRQTVQKMLDENIYNLIKYKTVKGVWSFFIVFHPHKIFDVSIDRNAYAPALKFNEAVGLAILEAINKKDAAMNTPEGDLSGNAAKEAMFPNQMGQSRTITDLNDLPPGLADAIRETMRKEAAGEVLPDAPEGSRGHQLVCV